MKREDMEQLSRKRTHEQAVSADSRSATALGGPTADFAPDDFGAIAGREGEAHMPVDAKSLVEQARAATKTDRCLVLQRIAGARLDDADELFQRSEIREFQSAVAWNLLALRSWEGNSADVSPASASRGSGSRAATGAGSGSGSGSGSGRSAAWRRGASLGSESAKRKRAAR
ncbi:unnamed protein product [Effrenium voratum]|nr:unnamed protein product [Effrenium voratum]